MPSCRLLLNHNEAHVCICVCVCVLLYQLFMHVQLIDAFMEERERQEQGARGVLVPQTQGPAAVAPPPGVDAQGRTPAMRIQEETVKLRVYLGFDVEQGGAGRCFQGGDSFVVVERRQDGAQVRVLCGCLSACVHDVFLS